MSFKSSIVANRRAVLELSNPELMHVLPVLYETRQQMAKSLSKFLKTDVDSTYTMQKHRALIVQLDEAIKTVENEMPSAMLKELRSGQVRTGKMSIDKLRVMVEEGEKRFSGAVSNLRIPVVKVLTSVQRTMMGRYEHRSDRYAGELGRRIRNDLAVGVIRGESVREMSKRLLGTKAEKMSPTDIADDIADKQFFRGYHDAERLVRTEMVNAYTETQVESLGEMNEDDPGWKKMWDAANDGRVCDDCDDLDGVVVDHDESFPGGIQGPPLHPNDRCSIVPWHERWGAPDQDELPRKDD